MGYLVLIPLAVLLLVREFLGPFALLSFILPVGGLALIGVWQRFGAAAQHNLVVRIGWVSAGAFLALMPWIFYFALQMGLLPFLSAVLWVGQKPGQGLSLPPAPPTGATLLLVVAVTVFALFGWLASRRGARTDVPDLALPPWLQALPIVSCIVLLAGIVVQWSAIKEVAGGDLFDVCSVTSQALDNLALYLSPLMLAAALAVAWRQARGTVRGSDSRSDTFLCVLWIAACSFLVYFPRMDYAHLTGALPLLYVVGVGLLGRVRESVRSRMDNRGARDLRLALNVSCALLAIFVVVTKSAVKIHSRVMGARSEAGFQLVPTPAEWVREDRATVYFPIYAEDMRRDIAMIREVFQAVRETTREGEPIFTFPQLAMVYFVTGRENATRQDYFLGGNVNYHDQQELIRTLEERRVQTVVLTNKRRGGFLAVDDEAIDRVLAYMRPRYRLKRRIGRYDIGRRGDSPPLTEGPAEAPDR
jgi:hypothetical protein